MKLSTGMLILCAMMILCTTAKAEIVEDTISNGNMESWSSLYKPDSWTYSGDVERSTRCYDGIYSAYLGSGGYIEQTCNIDIEEGYKVYYTAQHYDISSAVPQPMKMQIIFYDVGLNVLSTTSIQMKDFAYWGEYSGSVIAPESSTSVAIKFVSTGSNYIDGVSVSIDNIPVAQTVYINTRLESNVSVLNNASIILNNGIKEVSYTTTNGTVIIPASDDMRGECLLQVSSEAYTTRKYIVNAENITTYAALEDDCDLIRFNMIDYSNTFIYTDTRLIASQVSGDNIIIVSDSYFDAGGYNDVYLTSGVSYILELRTDDYIRSTGSIIPIQSQSTTLVVGQIKLIPESTVYGGFEYSFNKTNTSIVFTWEAQEDTLTDKISYTIYDSTDSIVYAVSSDILTGTATYTYADSEEQYKIVLTVPIVDGTLHRTEYVCGDSGIIDLQVSEHWYNIISLFILILIGLLFGARSASAGALITSLSAVGLYALGVFKVSSLIIALALVLGLMAVMRGRE